MYQKFENIMKKMSKIASLDMLLYIAGGLLGALLIYEIAMTITIVVMRRKRTCTCNIAQVNLIRRWASCTIAWLYTFFAFYNLIRINAGTETNPFQYSNILLPTTFLMAFYIIEFFFTAIQKNHCNCDTTNEPAPRHEKEPKPVHEKHEKELHEETEKKKGIIEEKNVETAPIVVIDNETPEHEAHAHRAKHEPKIEKPEPEEEQPAPEPQDTTPDEIKALQETVAQFDIPKIEPETTPTEPEINQPPAPRARATTASARASTPRAPRTTTPRATTPRQTTAAPAPRTPRQTAAKPSSAAPRTRRDIHDPEYLEELAQKIDKHRARAEQKTELMDSHGQLEAYSAQTHGALQDTAPHSQVAKEIIAREKEQEYAAKNAELQRRMEILRQQMGPNPNAQSRATPPAYKSVAELRREQDGLKLQYRTLQNKLDEIKYEKQRQMPEAQAPRPSSSIGVGYYSTVDNFERTGDRGYLPRQSSVNKFDEEEVRAALMGLHKAIDDLQAQIDRRSAHE